MRRPASFPALSLVLLLAAPLLLAAAKTGKEARPAVPPAVPATGAMPTATDPASTKWRHAPYEMGDCDACHTTRTPKGLGELRGEVNDLCLGCHEEIGARLKTRAHVHPAIDDDCTACHSPHESTRRMLLSDDLETLCYGCHAKIKKQVGRDVRHDAATTGRKCLNCHDPHAADIEHLLKAIPRDLCLDCHGEDGVLDQAGKPLTNFKTLLDENPVRHAPVESGDCSACHQPHGSANLRLLRTAYPAAFYTPFDEAAYALCFGCHEPANVTVERTTTLTAFRDGERNLHFLHVNRQDRGRTCRACHEVHASKQPHQIRDGVPYGSSGWVLKLQYVPTADGGTCAKTCHSAKTYSRTKAVNPEVPR